MILIIDNYDSFTYNIVQYVGETGAEIKVVRNDLCTLNDINAWNPEKIIISPGPGHPTESGITLDIIKHLYKEMPILGVCLGHQAIGMVFGGDIIQAETLFHGKASQIIHDSKTIFSGLENPFLATRYHSLIISRDSIPGYFEISAETNEGIVMGIRHKDYPLEGVQFHPESILTKEGKKLLLNFLAI